MDDEKVILRMDTHPSAEAKAPPAPFLKFLGVQEEKEQLKLNKLLHCT